VRRFLHRTNAEWEGKSEMYRARRYIGRFLDKTSVSVSESPITH
jgi:hypothetical protein